MNIERLEIVWAFKADKAIVLSLGPQIQSLAASLKGRIATINTPDMAPPELPRVVIQLERGLLHLGLNRCQLVLEPPQHINSSYSESMQFASTLGQRVLRDLVAGKRDAFEWSGIIATINYPRSQKLAPSALKAAAPVFQRLTTLQWPPESLAAFSLSVGRRVDGFFRNYGITGYELRRTEIAGPAGEVASRVL